jgi:type VI secretion system protein
MQGASIFERLIADNDIRKSTSNEENLYQSVANNLSHIFSTNAGSAQTAEDYGRPDLNNMNMSLKDSLETIEEKSELCIRKYEPRLYNTQVTILRKNLNVNKMKINIEGFLHINGKSHKVHYKANLLSNGKVRVYKDAK